ncbi:MAG: Lrp/AsnC family transcriptional regulator [Pseudomonadales bacterium]
MDHIDKALLAILRDDARKPVTVIAEILDLSRVTVQKRIAALEQADVINGYTVRTGRGYVSEKFRAQVLLGVKNSVGDRFTAFLRSFEEVVTVHSLAGRFDAMLAIEASSSEAIDRVLDRIREHPDVERTESCLVLSTKLDRRIA